MGNFNLIAPYYDDLAKIVFGDNLHLAKLNFISHIKSADRVLIIGGGTGDVLNDILAAACETKVDFIEPSTMMIKIAQQNLKQNYRERVNFINKDHHCIPHNYYDVVIVYFVLDVFRQEEALKFSLKINDALKVNGLWIFADFFYSESIFRDGIIWLMYRFFYLTAGLNTFSLPDYSIIFNRLKVKLIAETFFLNGLIGARLYEKTAPQ